MLKDEITERIKREFQGKLNQKEIQKMINAVLNSKENKKAYNNDIRIACINEYLEKHPENYIIRIAHRF